MLFFYYRETYGNNFIPKKKIIIIPPNQNTKAFFLLYLLDIFCQLFFTSTFLVSHLNLSSFKGSFKLTYVLEKSVKKIQKIKDFFEISTQKKENRLLNFFRGFFENLTYELKLTISVLKKGIFEGWVSLKTIKFYLFSFFHPIDFFFTFFSKIVKKKALGNQIFKILLKFYGKNSHFEFQKILFYSMENEFFRFFHFINDFFDNKSLIDNHKEFFSPILPTKIFQKYFCGNIFPQPLRQMVKIVFFLKNFLETLPGWKKNINFQNFYSPVRSERLLEILIYTKKIFYNVSKLIFDIFKKKIQINHVLLVFPQFLFFLRNQHLLHPTLLSSKINWSIFPKIFKKESKPKTEEKFFFHFLIEFSSVGSTENLLLKFLGQNFKKKKSLFHLRPFLSEFIKINCRPVWPFSLFLTQNSIKKYQILSIFFFRFRKIENFLLFLWKNQMTNRLKFGIFFVKNSIKLTHQILSFFHSFNSYAFFDVFERNHRKLEQQIFSIPEIHRVVRFNENFVNRLLREFFIGSPFLYKILVKILAISSLYCLFVKKKTEILTRDCVYGKGTRKFRWGKEILLRQNQIFRSNFEICIRKFFSEIKKEFFFQVPSRELEKTINFNNYYF